MKEFKQFRFSSLNNNNIIHGYYKQLNLTQSNNILGFSEGISLVITNYISYYYIIKFLIEDDVFGLYVFYQNNNILYKFYL